MVYTLCQFKNKNICLENEIHFHNYRHNVKGFFPNTSPRLFSCSAIIADKYHLHGKDVDPVWGFYLSSSCLLKYIMHEFNIGFFLKQNYKLPSI